MAGIPEYIQACEFRRDFLQQQLQWLREERHEFDNDADRLKRVEQRIRQELIGYLLPDIQDEHLDQLQNRLAYSGLRPIKQRYEAKFSGAEQRRGELEAMDEFQHYDYLIDQANRNVEDIRPKYDSSREQIAIWENSKWFIQLHKRKYFELDYQAGWFRRLLDWRAVSLLMSVLYKKGKLTFATPTRLQEYYRSLREETDDVIAAYQNLVAERDRINAIKSEHQELLTAPERLLAELFRELGDAVVSHLDACPEDLRIELARHDNVLNAFLRKQTGVRKQIQYLRELPITRIDSATQQLEQELAKTTAKIEKLKLQRRRGKRKSYTRSDIERIREVKAEKWQRRREKTTRLRSRIAEFDRYDHGSFASDYLWWDLMTGGAVADDIFEVRDFRDRHPDWDRSTYQDPTAGAYGMGAAMMYDDVAEDLASSMSDQTKDDAFVDPS